MPDARTDYDAAHEQPERPTESVRYPTNHVLGIVDNPDQLVSAARALKEGAFLDSEIEVTCGREAADILDANTGRTGLAHVAIRLAERLGAKDEEMETKERYEQALRDGRFVVSVLAPTEERKQRAAEILRDHGAHFVNFMGRFAIEVLHR
jgi:hypothetical protein